jgi:peptidoglycan/xylan/chitin deacetylase (PgdA/CDA1 family)
MLLGGVVAAAAAVALVRCGTDSPSQAAQVAPAPPAPPPPPEWPTLLPPPPPATRVALPGGAVLSALPGHGDLMALTLDDGVDTTVVRAYAQLARDTGLRLTMFANGVYSSWTDNRDLLLPLVESGQIQIGNHTWRHRDLTKLAPPDIADELGHNDRFLRDTFGIDAAPYFRPPYGAYNDLVTKVAGDLGYTVVTMWDGNIGDDAVLAPTDIVANASKYFVAQKIVIGHLNHPPVTGTYHQLLDVIAERQLRTVTLDDVFTKPEVSRLTSAYPG